MSSMRILLLGWDGVPPSLIRELVESGNTPNLSEIFGEGRFGEVVAPLPIVTPASWYSAFTGVEPYRHGIPHFVVIDREYRLRYMSISDLRVEALWDVLGRHGVEGLYLNLPVSTPAPRISGLWIGGEQIYREVREDDVYPSELVKELRTLGYMVGYPNISTDPGSYVSGLLMAESRRLDVFTRLMDTHQWGLSIYIAYSPDIVLHAFYGMDGYQDHIYRCFEELDRWLGALLNRLEKGDILILMSDHGHGYKEGYVNLLALLRSMGLLATRRPKGLRMNWVRRVGLVRRIWWRLPDRMRRWIGRYVLGNIVVLDTPSRVSGASIDWNATKAFPQVDIGGIKMHRADIFPRGVLDREEAYELAVKIVEELRRVDFGGSPIFRDVVLNFNDDPLTPDIYLEPRDNLWFKSRIDDGLIIPNRPERYLSPTRIDVAGDRASYHVRNGFIITYGEDIEPGDAGVIRMVDVMPTLLHMMGLPIPTGLDGDVAESILTREAINRDVKYERSLRRDLRTRSRSLRRRLKG